MTNQSCAEDVENGDDLDVSSAGSSNGGNNGGEEENSDNSGGSLSTGYNSFCFNFDSDEANKIGNVVVSSGSLATEDHVMHERGEAVSTADARTRAIAHLPRSFSERQASAICSLTSEYDSTCNSAQNPEALSVPEATGVLTSLPGKNHGYCSLRKRTQQEMGGAMDTQTKFSRGNSPEKIHIPREELECQHGQQDMTNDLVGCKADRGDRAQMSLNCSIVSDNQASRIVGATLSSSAFSLSDMADSSCVGLSKHVDHKSMPASKRKERNAREKDRSFRISQQIDQLREVLASGGVVVPKGIKSHVLTKALSYIQMLQQRMSSLEVEMGHLAQELRTIGNGTLGPDAALAIRQATAQNGLWTIGNFDKSFAVQCSGAKPQCATLASTKCVPQDTQKERAIEWNEYRDFFESSSVPLAIASMAGVFTDCNRMFNKISQYDKKDVCSMTIFNMIARSDLQKAFDQISSMVSPEERFKPQKLDRKHHILLRGIMRNNRDMGISVTMIRGHTRIPKCFLVALLKEAPEDASDQPILFTSFD